MGECNGNAANNDRRKKRGDTYSYMYKKTQSDVFTGDGFRVSSWITQTAEPSLLQPRTSHVHGTHRFQPPIAPLLRIQDNAPHQPNPAKKTPSDTSNAA